MGMMSSKPERKRGPDESDAEEDDLLGLKSGLILFDVARGERLLFIGIGLGILGGEANEVRGDL